MKKKLLALLPILLVGCLTGCGSEEKQADARFVDETWRTTETLIGYNDLSRQTSRFYSNEPGDYIDKVFFTDRIFPGYEISFDTNFYIWDDLEVYFVFSNGYITSTTKCRTLIAHVVKISKKIFIEKQLESAYIVEAHVRTVD